MKKTPAKASSNEMTDNPLRRCACMLVLDVSGSMAGGPVALLNALVRQLVVDLQQDEMVSHFIDIGIVTFGENVTVRQPITPVHQVGELQPFLSRGSAPMGKAVTRALKALEVRESEYRQTGVSFYPSQLMIISRGNPSDAWQTVADIARTLAAERKVGVLPLGIGRRANLALLGRFSVHAAMAADKLRLSECLLGFSASLARVSISMPGKPVPVPALQASSLAVLARKREVSLQANDGGPDSVQVGARAAVVKGKGLDGHQDHTVLLPVSGDRPAATPIVPARFMPRQDHLLQQEWKIWCRRHGQAISRRLHALVSPRREIEPAPIVAPTPPVRLSEPRNWLGAAETCVGAAHLRQEPPVPCQDAALAVGGGFPLLVVADGAGSSPVSDIGAQAVVVGLRRLVDTIARQYRVVLDSPDEPDEASVRALAHTLVRHACGLLEDLAAAHRRAATDFRCTLLVAVGGRDHWLWVRVGDGALIVEREGMLLSLGHAGKGEFANQTAFLGAELRPEQVQWGTEVAGRLTGVAAMTDGAAERLVSMDGLRISGQLESFFRDARAGKLRRTNLHAFLEDRDAWKGSSGDDRGLAILACGDQRVADPLD